MRILIVGAGIAGLTLSALLRQLGLRPRVIEKRRRRGREAGYVLGIRPLGYRVLMGLGLYERLEGLSLPLRYFYYADQEGEVRRSYELDVTHQEFGPVRMIQRGELLDLLQSELAGTVRFGVTVSHVEALESEVRVGFSDGTDGAFDLVVGCDGIHSQVRRLIFGTVLPKETGWMGWGWWADPAIVPDAAMTEYWEPGKRFCAVFPAKDVLCTVVGMRRWAPGAGDGVHRVRDCFRDMGGLVPAALASMPVGEQVFHDEFRYLRMKAWHHGRVVLVGDAASAFFPFGGLGLGGSLAMESAAVLADELSRADAGLVETALRFYEMRRRPRLERFEQAAEAIAELALGPPSGTTHDDLLALQERNYADFKDLMRSPI